MAYLLQHICVEVEICVATEIGSTKRCLKSVRVLDAQFSPNNYTGCCLLGLLYRKATIDKAEGVCLSL